MSALTGQAVLTFMQRLMDQVGEVEVSCELQMDSGVEEQAWSLRHFAGHLLQLSEHTAAYRLETSDVLDKTDLLPDLRDPLADIQKKGSGQPPPQTLRLGGAG